MKSAELDPVPSYGRGTQADSSYAPPTGCRANRRRALGTWGRNATLLQVD